MAAIPKLREVDIKNVEESNLPEDTKKKVLALMNMYYVNAAKIQYVLYLAPGTTCIDHLINQVVNDAKISNANYTTRDVNSIDTISEDGLTLLYAFNHNAGRFQNSLGIEKFKAVVRKAKWNRVFIIEFGVGDKDSAKNNPQETTLFEYETGKPKVKVIKFWYDVDFMMTAKTENDESTKILCAALHPNETQICAHIKFGGCAGRYTLKTTASRQVGIFDKKIGAFFCAHTFRDVDHFKARDRASSSTCVCPECE